MKRYQHTKEVVELKFPGDWADIRLLDSMSSDGWELCAVGRGSGSTVTLYLRREVE